MSRVARQITDALTQTNCQIIGSAGAFAMGMTYQTMAHSIGLMFENAVSSQQQHNTLALASTTMGVTQLYSMNTVADSTALAELLKTKIN